MRRWTLAVVAVAVGATCLALPGGPAQARTAHAFNGSRRIGAFFLPGFYPGLHTCTASVVRSRHHDVIMTAAHCLNEGAGAGYEFVPAYHGGTAPYGVWHTTAAYVGKKWVHRGGDTRRDFAFLTVAPRVINGKRQRIQDVVGGFRLGRGGTAGQPVRITGYPLGVAGRPITCSTRVSLHRGYPTSHCHGFADGTSGGPWVAGHGRRGAVVGLISGLHQGGCSPNRVYSTPLRHPARAVLRRAEHHRHPDSLPQRPSDGCSSPNL
jgi:V8-like Glu-specific endopeptidase